MLPVRRRLFWDGENWCCNCSVAHSIATFRVSCLNFLDHDLILEPNIPKRYIPLRTRILELPIHVPCTAFFVPTYRELFLTVGSTRLAWSAPLLATTVLLITLAELGVGYFCSGMAGKVRCGLVSEFFFSKAAFGISKWVPYSSKVFMGQGTCGPIVTIYHIKSILNRCNKNHILLRSLSLSIRCNSTS
jgi:hypothetical protein